MNDRIAVALERIATALEATSGDDDLDTLVQALSAEVSPTAPQDAPRGPTRQMGGVKRYDLGEGWWLRQRPDPDTHVGFALTISNDDTDRYPVLWSLGAEILW